MGARAMGAAAVLALSVVLVGGATGRLERLQSFRKECFPAIPCVMILDRDGSYGCGQCTEDSISEEVSEILQSRALENFLEAGSVRRFLLIPQILFFKAEFLNSLQFKFSNIAGMIIYDGFPGEADQLAENDEDATTPDAISTDREIPNEAFSSPRRTPPDSPKFLYNNNSGGETTPAQFAFYPFNIFRVNATVAARIRERVQQFSPAQNEGDGIGTDATTGTVTSTNRGGMSPSYVLQSNGRMYACPKDAKEQLKELEEEGGDSQTPAGFDLTNSEKCLKDLTCFPIGGQSVWSSLGALEAPAKKNILAITAPMDSTAFFHGVAQGAAAEIASLATMMAVAEAVGEYRRGAGKDKVMVRQPVYFAWNAQSWGFSGSSRFLKDVIDFKCTEKGDNGQGCKVPYKPSLRFKDLKDANWAVLNLNSILDPGLPSGQSETEDAAVANATEVSFYMHGRVPNTKKEEGTETLIRDTLTDVFGEDTISNAGIPYRPPDASQSFFQLLNVETVSLTNYETTFTNLVYHSQFDNVSRIPESRRNPLYSAAEGVARTVIKLCFEDDPKKIEVKRATINGFIGCMTSNWSATDCALSREYQGDEDFRAGQQAVRSGNFAGVFVPAPREDQNPSQKYKTGLIRKFLMYHNRIEEGPPCLADGKENTFDDDICKKYEEDLNVDAVRAKNESLLRPVECVRKICIASDTFRHDAYGTGIDTTAAFGANRTDENVDDPLYEVNAEGKAGKTRSRDYEVPQFTESHWDPELGVCGLTEDSSLFGYSILFGGVGINVVSFVVAWFMNGCLEDKKEREEEDDLEEERAPIVV